MNLILTIIEPPQEPIYRGILERLKLPVSYELLGRGTASGTLLQKLRLEPTPKRLLINLAGEESTGKLMQRVKRELYIDAPGNGISVSVPIKSVGGAKTLEFLKGADESAKTPRSAEYENELIVIICNEGYSEAVMDAARAAGARGGTIVHAKGSARSDSRFYNVTISDEKELLLIVAASADKAQIMRAVLEQCGPSSPAGGISFSLPVSLAMGLNTGDGGEA